MSLSWKQFNSFMSSPLKVPIGRESVGPELFTSIGNACKMKPFSDVVFPLTAMVTEIERHLTVMLLKIIAK